MYLRTGCKYCDDQNTSVSISSLVRHANKIEVEDKRTFATVEMLKQQSRAAWSLRQTINIQLRYLLTVASIYVRRARAYLIWPPVDLLP